MAYALLFFFVAVILLQFVRSGKGGKFGERIRASDWRAWRDAMDEKERELQELKGAEPKR